MGLRDIVKDSVDQSVVIRIIDDTDFKPENGVEHNTAGIDLWYRREGAVVVSIVEAALASLNSAHADGGIELIGDGYYRFDLPDAAFATAADGVMIGGTVTGMIVEGAYVPLVDDPISVNVTQLSGNVTAANNLQAQYDTTGLDGDTFPATQLQLGRIALTGAAVNTPAKDEPNGFVIAWGENEANDEDATHAADGTYHDIEAQNDGGTQKIDAYYEFDIGGDGLPESVTWKGYLSKGGGANKNITVQAYNWTTWDQIGSISSGVSSSAESFTLFTSHVGTGVNIGKVRIRFVTGSVVFSATTLLKTDQIFLSYAIVTRTVGYANGEIWVNTNLSNTKTESFVDGTADNPVSTWAAALILSSQLNITHFHIANGSTITLSANSDNYVLDGHEWTLVLAGQSCDDAAFTGAHVTGACTGVEVVFNDCDLAADGGTLTAAGIEAHNCALAGSIVLTAANTYFFDKCYSAIAGTSTPDLDFGATVGSQNVNFRHYSGGIEIKNMGATGTDKMSLEGHGQLILNSSCDPANSPVIAIRGHFTVTDNVAGGFVAGGGTLSDDARYDVTQILDAVIDDSTRIDASQLNTHTTITPASSAELTTHDNKLDTAQNDLNTLTGADGATLATLQGNYAPNVVVPDVAGTAATEIAAAHVTTDALIAAVPTVTEIQTEMEENGASILDSIRDKLPSKDYLAGTGNADGDIEINEATGNYPGSVGSVAGAVGSVTAGVDLADAAITSAKYDETTAFPVKSDDSGATQIARVGADGDTLETLSDQIDDVVTLGVGATAWTYTLTDTSSGLAIADADIWVTSDEAGADVIATGRTNISGIVTFYLDLGATVYIWGQKGGYNFDNPDTEVVS